MNRLGTLRIGQVIGLGFGLILLIALITAVLGRIAYDITLSQRDTIQTRGDVESLTLELELLSIRRTEALRRYLATANVSFLANSQLHQAAYIDAYSRLADLLTTPEEIGALQAVGAAAIELDDKAQEVLRLYSDGFPASARFLWDNEGTAAQQSLFEAMELLRRVQGNTSAQIVAEARRTEDLVVLTVSILIPMILIGGVLLSLLITRNITGPISKLVEQINLLSSDLTTRLKPSGPQEIAFLGETINDMATSLDESGRALQAHKERMEDELNLASQIQASFLPNILPRRPGLDIATFWQSAREVGGDFYTFIELESDRLGLTIGDVSGKGAPAAMAGSLAVGLVEAYAPGYSSPEALLARLNQELHLRLQANKMNVACCYSILDLTSGDLTVANAGSLYPYLRHDGQLHEVAANGLPLGAWPDFNYLPCTCTLQPGDLLLLGSDGLVEAKNKQGDMFGFERLELELKRLPVNVTAQEAVDQLVKLVKLFTVQTDLHDDITLMAIRLVAE